MLMTVNSSKPYGEVLGAMKLEGEHHVSVELRELYLTTIELSCLVHSRSVTWLLYYYVRFCRMESWPRTEKSSIRKMIAN